MSLQIAEQTTSGRVFRAVNPVTGEKLEPAFPSAAEQEVGALAQTAARASAAFARSTGAERAELLRTIAENLSARGEAIVARAILETGLPLPRLQSELARTTGQLRLFADVVEEGSWVDARLDEALPTAHRCRDRISGRCCGRLAQLPSLARATFRWPFRWLVATPLPRWQQGTVLW